MQIRNLFLCANGLTDLSEIWNFFFENFPHSSCRLYPFHLGHWKYKILYNTDIAIIILLCSVCTKLITYELSDAESAIDVATNDAVLWKEDSSAAFFAFLSMIFLWSRHTSPIYDPILALLAATGFFLASSWSHSWLPKSLRIISGTNERKKKETYYNLQWLCVCMFVCPSIHL